MTTDMTMKLLAMELRISVDRLICQFANIGIQKTNLDYVTEYEKKVLFMNIDRNNQQVGILNKLTLQRKIHSTLNVFSSGGKSKKVQVEVRRKHTYVQQSNSKVLTEVSEGIISSLHINDSSLSCCSMKNNDLSVDIKDLPNNLNQFKEEDVRKFTDKKKGQSLVNKVIENKVLSVPVQYKNRIKDTSHVFEKNRKYNASISSLSCGHFKIDKVSEYDKKKISNDRKIRGRQRFRSASKLRNDHKVDVNNTKYKKNYDDFIDVMRCDRDEIHTPVSRGMKNLQRKVSILTHAFNKPTHVVSRNVIIGEMITVSELANKMAIKSSHIIKVMMEVGIMVTINQSIDQKTAQLIVKEMGHNVILRSENDVENIIMNDRNYGNDGSSNRNISNVLKYRAPVVTIMGHVDHGKTSLLDCIRSSKVVDSEAGGITQHIGAYSVETDHNKMITFLDTPGHAAFTAMRMRGVKITDIVVLVVAVDDGVMLQTIEAIRHVKDAKIPMIVALNKIDKVDSADMGRIMNDLAQQGVISEEWGGETQFVRVSAKSGIGIDNLLTAILLESELLELKVIHDGMASGIVVESYLDKGKGPVAIILVREGTLRCGDIILCGLEYGRIRAMRNEIGDNITSAGPSIPVEVFGLSGPPCAGDSMIVVRNERKAREVALYRQEKFRAIKLAKKKHNSLEHTLTGILSEENIGCLRCNIILKADVQGSVETINDILKSLSNEFDLKINIISSGVGWINETDVSLAIATGSVLFAFNVRTDILARRIIESENLSIYYHSVIYDLINDVKKLINSMLTPRYKKINIALAEVRSVFNLPKLGSIAGCMILEGIVRRHNQVRVLRNKIVICEGELESLRRFKDDVNEVRAGMECGVVIDNYKDIQLGDHIQIFENINVNNDSINNIK